MTVEIRAPRPDELERLREVERAAGAAFAEVGLAEVAAHEPASTAELDGYRADGRAWVLLVDGALVGYLLADVVDGHGHVEQVSVHPEAAGHGLGRRLLEHALAWASARGDQRLTLTTFRDVPWNAPYYERLGYRVLEDHEVGPELRALMTTEAAHGLDPDARVAMAHELPPRPGIDQDRRP